VRKAPSLSVSRPLHGGKYKFGWNLKTDDVSLEYSYKALKFVAFKSPKQPVPRVAASIEHDFEVRWGIITSRLYSARIFCASAPERQMPMLVCGMFCRLKLSDIRCVSSPCFAALQF
jgi:hypothetical protein